MWKPRKQGKGEIFILFLFLFVLKTEDTTAVPFRLFPSKLQEGLHLHCDWLCTYLKLWKLKFHKAILLLCVKHSNFTFKNTAYNPLKYLQVPPMGHDLT